MGLVIPLSSAALGPATSLRNLISSYYFIEEQCLGAKMDVLVKVLEVAVLTQLYQRVCRHVCGAV